MYDIGSSTEFNIKELTDYRMCLTNNKGSLSLRLTQPVKIDNKFLIGDWIDYSDSVLSPPKLFNEGIHFINSKLTITPDSLDIIMQRTNGMITEGSLCDMKQRLT